MRIEEKLAQLGIRLPEAPAPLAAYVPTVRTGSLVFVSGQLPFDGGRLLCTGKVPSAVSIEQAQQAARQCAINGLAALAAELDGDLSRMVRVVRLGAFVQSDDGFADQAKVANGASELMQQLFEDAGRHARAAVGVNALPLDATVELELLFEISL